MILDMTSPVVVVADSGPADETQAVAAATTEVVARAFSEGVRVGEDAARVDQFDTVSRSEYDAVVARLDALEGTAVEAIAVAETAIEIAIVAADEQETNGAGKEGDGETDSGEPKPPERRDDKPAETTPAPTDKPERKGYGNRHWFNS